MEEQLLISIPQAAKILLISENSLRVWLCKDKVLPKCIVVRLGSRVFFNRELFIAWVKGGCKKDFQGGING